MSEKKTLQLVDVLQPGESVVSMITFQSQMYVATTRNVYVIKYKKIYPLELVMEKEEEDASSKV